MTQQHSGRNRSDRFASRASRRRTHLVFGPLLAVGLSLSACADSDAPAPASEPPPTVVSEPGGAVVEIDLDEYTVFMDAVVPAGEVTFNLANRGFEEHNLLFVVTESDSTIWEMESRMAPGERRSVTLHLEPGAYRAVCDFSGHQDRGMLVSFSVRETTPGEDGS